MARGEEVGPAPKIEVLGIHRLTATQQLIAVQADTLYGVDLTPEERARAEAECREQLESVALIEVMVENPNGGFSVIDFSQPGSDQAAYLETFLSEDGEQVVDDGEQPSQGAIRVAFFLHFYDVSKPLQTSYGPVTCPGFTPMPERLARLVPYEPVD